MPLTASSFTVDEAADTVTISGSLTWINVIDGLGLARPSTDYTVVLPFADGPFDPDFSSPAQPFPGGFSQLPGLIRIEVDDPKFLTGTDIGDGLAYALYGEPGDQPSDLGNSDDGVTSASFTRPYITGPLDGDQTYTLALGMTDDFSAVENVGIFMQVRDPVEGTDFFTEELYLGLETADAPIPVGDIGCEDFIDRSAETAPQFIDGGVCDDTLLGGDGADTILGGADNDSIDGGRGGDDIDGGTGADTIAGSFGGDTILGGDGDDTIDGGAGWDSVSGGDGDDSLFGDNGEDTLDGGAGDDTLDGGRSEDTLLGGTDNDSLTGGGAADSLDGGFGNDTLAGDAGADTLTGGGGDDRAFGASGGDVMGGGSGNDRLVGQAGWDTINGGSGEDTILGGRGRDVMSGEGGNDLLRGFVGDDTIEGGRGNDTIEGEQNNDRLTGGLGVDTFVFGTGFGRDTITDFTAGEAGDILEFALGTGEATSLQDFLDNASEAGPDLVYDKGSDGRNVITLQGVTEADLVAANLAFV